ARRTLRHRRAAAGIPGPRTPLVVRIPIGRGVPTGIALPHRSITGRPCIGSILRPVIIPVVRAVIWIPVESAVTVPRQQVLELADDDRADHNADDGRRQEDDLSQRRTRPEVASAVGTGVVGIVRPVEWIPSGPSG